MGNIISVLQYLFLLVLGSQFFFSVMAVFGMLVVSAPWKNRITSPSLSFPSYLIRDNVSVNTL